MHFPIAYEEPLFRPPGEAQSLLIQLTVGCSHNSCSFCAMYRSKSFRLRGLAEIERDMENASQYFTSRRETVRKLFLCDGDALAAPASLIAAVLERAKSYFPGLRRTSIYAAAANILRKKPAELSLLKDLGLSLAYFGLESGSDNVLQLAAKGNTAEEAVEALKRLQECGWQTSVIVMLGLGGKRFSAEHRRATAEVISNAPPRFLSFLTTTAVPGTPYYEQVCEGTIEELSCRELLEEMHYLIENIRSAERIIFRANHVSNQFPLEGVLPKDRSALLSLLIKWIHECPPDLYPRANPFML